MGRTWTRTVAWMALVIAGCTFDPSGIDGRCGNGIVEPGEQCDGVDLGGATCESLGLGAGTLGCTPQCKYDVSGCEGSGDNGGTGDGTCGNGIVEVGEECDGTVPLDVTSCEDLGYYGGAVECGSDCRLDYTDCEAHGYCGDGILQEGMEECDDGTANSDTDPDACRTDCTAPTCGDGVVDTNEECDGTPPAGTLSCEDLGYYGGAVECGSDCRLDYTDCEAHGYCGDGTVQENFEECDGSVPPDTPPCEEMGYYGGSVSCTRGCQLDYTDCEAHGWCGDGILQSDHEICDSTGIVEFGHMHGECRSCTTLILYDQLIKNDGEAEYYNDVVQLENGEVAVVGTTHGDMFGQSVSNYASFLIIYGTDGLRGAYDVYEEFQGIDGKRIASNGAGRLGVTGNTKYISDYDPFVRLYDYSANAGWTETGWSKADYGEDIALVDDDVYLTMIDGSSGSRAYVKKFDPNGDEKESVRIDDELDSYLSGIDNDYSVGDAIPYAIYANRDAVYVVGTVEVDSPNTGETSWQAFAMKFTRNLDVRWVTVWGSEDENVNEEARGVVKVGGHVYVTGTYNGASQLLDDHEGGQDSFVVELDDSGAIVDAVLIPGPGDDMARDIATNGSDAIYVVGRTNSQSFAWITMRENAHGGEDGFLCRISLSSLSVDWCMMLGTSGQDGALGVDHGSFHGHDAVFVSLFSNGQMEPGVQKTDTSYDGVLMIMIEDGI